MVTSESWWQPTPVFLPGKSHGWWNLVGYSPWGCKESDTTEQLHFHFHFLKVPVKWNFFFCFWDLWARRSRTSALSLTPYFHHFAHNSQIQTDYLTSLLALACGLSILTGNSIHFLPLNYSLLLLLSSFSRVWLLATPWTAAYQAPPSMGFSRQECWSGVPLPSPNDLISLSKYQE